MSPILSCFVTSSPSLPLPVCCPAGTRAVLSFLFGAGLGDNLQGLSQECLPALLASVERLAAQGCDPGTPGDQPSVLASAAASLTAAYAPGAIIVIARRGLSAGGRGGLLLVGGPDGAPQAPWDHALRAVGPLLGHLGRALGRTFLSTFLGSGRVPRRQSPLAAEAAAAKRGAGGAARGEGGAGAGAVDRGGSPGEKAEIGLCTKGEEGPTVVILQPQTVSPCVCPCEELACPSPRLSLCGPLWFSELRSRLTGLGVRTPCLPPACLFMAHCHCPMHPCRMCLTRTTRHAHLAPHPSLCHPVRVVAFYVTAVGHP